MTASTEHAPHTPTASGNATRAGFWGREFTPEKPESTSRLVLGVPDLRERDTVLDLFEVAVDAEPDYLPMVHSGAVTVAEWFDRKPDAEWARVAYLDGRIVGYVAARRYDQLPNSEPVGGESRWELMRMVVHPDARGQGVAEVLVRHAYDTFGWSLWATCHRDGRSHRLFSRLGWATEDIPVEFLEDPRPGALLLAP